MDGVARSEMKVVLMIFSSRSQLERTPWARRSLNQEPRLCAEVRLPTDLVTGDKP